MTIRENIGSFDAKTRFSEILHKVENEEIEYVVTRHGKPIAIITSYVAEEENNLKEIVTQFIDYRDKRDLTLNREHGISFRDMIHESHRC